MGCRSSLSTLSRKRFFPFSDLPGEGVEYGPNLGRDVEPSVLNEILRERDDVGRLLYLVEKHDRLARHEGKTVRYLPLYMLPLVARELSKGSLDGVVAQPPTW